LSKRDDKIEFQLELNESNISLISDDLITKVVIGLGPSIYNKNSEIVACTKPNELETIKNNFLKKS